MDNIFSNFCSHEIISGNVTATVSDHLPQFPFVPNILSKSITQKSDFFWSNWSDWFWTDWSNLNKETLFLSILIKIRLNYFKLINKMLISVDSFLNYMNFIFDAHASLK